MGVFGRESACGLAFCGPWLRPSGVFVGAVESARDGVPLAGPL